MPVVKVYGFPGTFQRELIMISEQIEEVICHFLKLKSNEVSIFFPTDLLQARLREEIIVFVDGLFEKKERTDLLRKVVAREIAIKIKQHYKNALVEVFVRPFDPKLGFCSISIDDVLT